MHWIIQYFDTKNGLNEWNNNNRSFCDNYLSYISDEQIDTFPPAKHFVLKAKTLSLCIFGVYVMFYEIQVSTFPFHANFHHIFIHCCIQWQQQHQQHFYYYVCFKDFWITFRKLLSSTKFLSIIKRFVILSSIY